MIEKNKAFLSHFVPGRAGTDPEPVAQLSLCPYTPMSLLGGLQLRAKGRSLAGGYADLAHIHDT